ncbi:MAG: AAA family ATPase [Chloroflexota bacterium]|nr:AAA family ATPase [Chloroflexota bacterium]
MATYDYTDPEGELLYQVVRFQPKTFRQRRPDGNGGWVWNLKGTKPVLYRLPEVLQAVADGQRVYICEGEKDVNGLWGLGLAATTNSGGAGKWRDSYSKALEGADVVIIPDNDGPGRDHATKVAASLHGIAKSIKVLGFPDRDGCHVKDVSDWLQAGGTASELDGLVAAAPQPQPPQPTSGFRLTPLSDLLAEPPESIAWVWADTLPAGGLSILAAKPKVGKSTLARNLALAVACGKAFLGRDTSPGPVVYLGLEEKRSEVAAHFERMGATSENIFIHTGGAPDDAIAALQAAICDKGAVLAILDPLQRGVRLRDTNDYAQVSLALEPLLLTARDTGCHIVAVHHLGKLERDGADGVLGSTALFGSVDTALIMRRRNDGGRTIESVQRYGEDIPKIALSFDSPTGLTDAQGTVEELDVHRASEAILDFLTGDEATQEEIRAIEGYRAQTLRKALTELVNEGVVARVGSGRKGDPFRYSNAGSAGSLYISGTRKQEFSTPELAAIETSGGVTHDRQCEPENQTDVTAPGGIRAEPKDAAEGSIRL